MALQYLGEARIPSSFGRVPLKSKKSIALKMVLAAKGTGSDPTSRNRCLQDF